MAWRHNSTGDQQYSEHKEHIENNRLAEEYSSNDSIQKDCPFCSNQGWNIRSWGKNARNKEVDSSDDSSNDSSITAWFEHVFLKGHFLIRTLALNITKIVYNGCWGCWNRLNSISMI